MPKTDRRELTTGIYVTGEPPYQTLEIDVPELIAHLEMEDTPENRETIVQLGQQACEAAGLKCKETTIIRHSHKHTAAPAITPTPTRGDTQASARTASYHATLSVPRVHHRRSSEMKKQATRPSLLTLVGFTITGSVALFIGYRSSTPGPNPPLIEYCTSVSYNAGGGHQWIPKPARDITELVIDGVIWRRTRYTETMGDKGSYMTFEAQGKTITVGAATSEMRCPVGE